jgi:hypothetical protein
MTFFEQILIAWGFICGFVFALVIVRIAIALEDEEKP